MQKVTTRWQIAKEMQGLRADQYLVRIVGRLSRQRAQRIILAQEFLLNNKPIKPSHRVGYGEEASLCRFAPDEQEDIQHFNVGVIYEDDDLLVINKPYYLSIHPTANCLYKTLTFWLKKNYPLIKINPCHRIDKETTGLLVCAKTRSAESIIKTLFLKQEVKKTYLAIIHGELNNSKLIDLPLGLQKDRGLVAIRMIHDEEGFPSKTYVRKVKYYPSSNRTLVLCRPKTGRQHQIRAHLSLIGHPIVGDKLYGQDDEFFDEYCKTGFLPTSLGHFRHLLHAYKLSFKYKDNNLTFMCELPHDFK